jgi:tetratricopeptide (TPR) repeat protein
LKSYAFIRTYCYSEAVKSAELSVDAFRAIPDTFHVQRTKVQLADAYHATKEFEKALGIYQDLIRTCQNDTLIMRRALIHCAYSMYLAHPERADSSMRYYERALNDYKATLGTTEAAHFGEVAAMTGNIQLAHQIVDQLKASGKHPEQRAYLEYKLLVKESKPWEAIVAAGEFLSNVDSVMVDALEQSLVKAQRNYQEQQKQSAEHALYLSKWIGSVSVLCLLFVLLSLWLYYSRKHKIASLEREQLIGSVGEMAKLLQESEQANSDLRQDLETAQKRYVAAYKKQFSKISSIIENYYTSSGMKNGRDIVYRQVMDVAATIGQDQTRMSVLEKDVNAALDNAMKWYRLEFPEKGSDHYRMVCLFMAGFTVPMIEILTSVTKNTLYSRKSRLLEQIRNSDAEHKDLFLMAIQ